MQGMTDHQKMMFLSQYSGIRKDGTVGVLLAFFLGGFGAHRFYLGQIGMGILYIVFAWTFIPALIALIECFLMSSRVREYNGQHAAVLAMQIRAAFPAAAPPLVQDSGQA